MNIKPFQKIDSFEKAIYNYQYYNTMAKYYYMKAREISKYGKHQEKHKEFLDKVHYFYQKKDKATWKAIEILDFCNIEAYYIQVSSAHLKRSLFEIVFHDYEHIILHSKSKWLLNRLKEEGLFKEEVRKSLIEGYINQKY